MKKQLSKISFLVSLLMSVLFISCDATQEDKDLERFSQVLSKKIEKSESRMSDLQYQIEQGGIEAIDFSPLTDKEDDIFYYVYKNDSLVFWTENEIGVPLRFYHGNWSSPLVFFPHTDVVRMLYIADDFTILSLIKLKDNYDEKLLSLPANQSLFDNDMARGFDLENVSFYTGLPTDENAVFYKNLYLFSVSTENVENNHKNWFEQSWFWLKEKTKYMLQLAQNYSVEDNQSAVYDRRFERRMPSLSFALSSDEDLRQIVQQSDSISSSQILYYLGTKYFKGGWKSFSLSATILHQEQATQDELIRASEIDKKIRQGQWIEQSAFYFVEEPNAPNQYLARFDYEHHKLYISLTSKEKQLSYCYPISFFMLDSKAEEHDDLPVEYNPWIITAMIVILLAILSSLFFIFRWIFRWIRNKQNGTDAKIFRFGFVDKLHLTVFAVVICAFVLIAIFVGVYLIDNHRKQWETEIQQKAIYIERYIENSFSYVSSFDEVESQFVRIYIHDLANTYETDVHLYDRKGELIATSQPALFFKQHLLAPYMSAWAKELIDDDFEIKTAPEQVDRFMHYITYVRIRNEQGKTLGFVGLPSFLSLSDMQSELLTLIAMVIDLFVLVVVIVILLSLVVSRRFSQSLLILSQRLQTVSLNHQNEKLDYDGNDEIAQLVEQYNLMVDQLEMSAQRLSEAEREAAWKTMARQVTHEIKNPLTPMKLSIQQLMRLKQTEPDSERFFAYFDKCTSMLIEQIDTLSVIATAFGDYAKSKMQIERQEVDVIKTIQSVVDLYANNEEKVQIVLSDERPNELQQPFVVNAEGKGMTQVFSNLIKNAIQAKQKNQEGKILISIFCENEKFIVKIKDNGVGMNAQQLERIFEPNFTTKTSGMGLGLPIVRNILQQIGATISVSSSEGVGTEFVIEF